MVIETQLLHGGGSVAVGGLDVVDGNVVGGDNAFADAALKAKHEVLRMRLDDDLVAVSGVGRGVNEQVAEFRLKPRV